MFSGDFLITNWVAISLNFPSSCRLRICGFCMTLVEHQSTLPFCLRKIYISWLFLGQASATYHHSFFTRPSSCIENFFFFSCDSMSSVFVCLPPVHRKISHNHLSGQPFPVLTKIPNLTMAYLSFLASSCCWWTYRDLGYNKFSGAIPTGAFANLSYLQVWSACSWAVRGAGDQR